MASRHEEESITHLFMVYDFHISQGEDNKPIRPVLDISLLGIYLSFILLFSAWSIWLHAPLAIICLLHIFCVSVFRVVVYLSHLWRIKLSFTLWSKQYTGKLLLVCFLDPNSLR